MIFYGRILLGTDKFMILKTDFRRSVIKKDAIIVYTYSGQTYVCELGGIQTDGDFLILTPKGDRL